MSGAAEAAVPTTAASAGPSEGHPSKKPHLRGDIEGLRAVAVGTVLLYHVGIPLVPGGFVGVDVFFVISGFLITSLLLREASRSGRISIMDFYARRARRLLPAASVVLVISAIAGWVLLPGSERSNLASDVVTATLYVINWSLALRSVDYLAEDSAPSIVQHYWSLSVEEQFYVVWPLVVLIGLHVARRTRVRVKPLLFGVLSVVAVASFVYSVAHTQADPATAYFFTTTRIWELAVGALLAFLVVRLGTVPRRAAELIAALGLALLAWSALSFTAETPWPGWSALAPTLGAAMVIAAGCATPWTATARLLSTRPLVWIGGLSYGIYLWHWPLITLAKQAFPEVRLHHLIVLGSASVGLAWLTKRLVEDPIRFNPVLSAKAGRGLLFGGASMLVTVAVGAVVWASVPRLDPHLPIAGATSLIEDPRSDQWRVKQSADLAGVIPTTGPVSPDPAVAREDVPAYNEDGCQIRPGNSQINLSCVYGDEDGSTTVALLGDSKMGQWTPAVNAVADEEQWRVELYLKSTCAFSYEAREADCSQFARNVVAHFTQEGAPDVAFVSQGAPRSERLRSGSAEAIRDLEALGTKVVVIADTPRPDQSQVYTCVEEHPDDFTACSFDAAKNKGREGTGTANLRFVADELDLPLVDLNQWICPPGERCPPVIGGTMIYRQGSHVTASYIRTMTPILYRALAEQGITSRPASEIPADLIP